MTSDQEFNDFFNAMNWAAISFARENFGGGALGGTYLYRGKPTVEQLLYELTPEKIREFIFEIIEEGPCFIDTFIVWSPTSTRISLARGEASSEFEFRVDGVRCPTE